MAEKKHKKETKAKEKVSPKQIAERIKKSAEIMVKQIEKQEDPEFTTMQRGKSNVVWDEKKGYLALGDKEIKRTFLNIAHARKFMQTTLIMQKTQDYLLNNKTASIREIYYELKHTIKGTKENTFEGQDESDPIIVDLEHSVDTIREKLNLHANPKGTLYGNITLKDKMHNNDKFNASKLGRGGWSIMSRIEPEEIELLETDAEYLLVCETEAMFERLIEEGYPKPNKCLLIGTGGQAARGARRLIHRIHEELDLPVYVFTDGDPYGWYIYSVIKQGSMALAAHSEFMSVPDAKYIGMTLDDVKNYELENVTEHMKEGDVKRAKEMMAYPWFQNKEWQDQLKKAITQKIRIEQQALANKKLDFVATHYLPEKIRNNEFLP
ncbi:MAG: DNA topoisomerase IV subunit A [Candidatus Diapherotrites archaeon]|uniref:Type 2 DNA topoisomerase 6 subunit A n=1 Tax=Candidatus Iainarchaeum sp. TaxID=3101447 RepID=A0A7K4BZY3_9ARCH|nr:DNA topoisomerase IV subunit A [Candidatus Diapherotrites archaeon]